MKESSRKRRKKNEVKEDEASFKCPYCETTLSRKQTLNEHVRKLHPENAMPEMSRKWKGKGKGKNSSAQYKVQQGYFTLVINSNFGRFELG